jgi:hypothetical protein
MFTASKFLWICFLVLSVPWTGSAIHPHLLEHEAENNRARTALLAHVHQSVHLDAAWDLDASRDCFGCLRTQSKGMACAPAPPPGSPERTDLLPAGSHEYLAAFRLAGSVTPRGPPPARLDSI